MIEKDINEEEYASEIQYMDFTEHVMALDCIWTIIQHVIKQRLCEESSKVAERRLLILKDMLKEHVECLAKKP